MVMLIFEKKEKRYRFGEYKRGDLAGFRLSIIHLSIYYLSIYHLSNNQSSVIYTHLKFDDKEIEGGT